MEVIEALAEAIRARGGGGLLASSLAAKNAMERTPKEEAARMVEAGWRVDSAGLALAKASMQGAEVEASLEAVKPLLTGAQDALQACPGVQASHLLSLLATFLRPHCLPGAPRSQCTTLALHLVISLSLPSTLT